MYLFSLGGWAVSGTKQKEKGQKLEINLVRLDQFHDFLPSNYSLIQVLMRNFSSLDYIFLFQNTETKYYQSRK